MARVLACIDSSSYSNSVCDHAAWFAGRSEAAVDVLNVIEETAAADAASSAEMRQAATQRSDALLDHAVSRLRDEGVADVGRLQFIGGFVDLAARESPELIVMGKRGDSSESHRRRLGSSVDAMVRATSTALCLTSKLYLPIHRGLILLDADLSHRTSVEFVAAHPSLNTLDLDIVVVAAPDEDPEPKLNWARATLAVKSGAVFALRADGLDSAATQYMESRAADIVVVSRTVIAPDPQARLGRIEERGVWGMRTPVVIC